MRMKLFCLWLMVLSLIPACKSTTEVLESPRQLSVVSQGGVYVSCESAPFYLTLDSLFICSIDLPIDSAFSTQWQAVCQMTEVIQDSATADIELRYLSQDMEVLSMSPVISALPIDLVVNGDTISGDNYPYYGAYEITRGDEVIELFMVNRYIGGCFHDELIWRRTQ